MVGTRLLAAAALAGLVLLGGCNKVKRGDYDSAVSENTELRERLGEAQASLTEVNEQSTGEISSKSNSTLPRLRAFTPNGCAPLVPIMPTGRMV